MSGHVGKPDSGDPSPPGVDRPAVPSHHRDRGGGVLLFVPGRYDASATASIDPVSVDPISEMSTGAGATTLMQGNIISLVTSQRVATDVVKRLNLTDNPQVQQNFRKSSSFGRESIEEWMAANLVRSVDPKFNMGTNVLSIKYKSGDPEPGGVDRQCVSRRDDRRLGSHEGRRGGPDGSVVRSANRRIARRTGAGAHSARDLPGQDEHGGAVCGGRR